MEDGEKDEMKLRGGSIGDEEMEIATYLEMNERDRRRRRCSAIGRRLRLSTRSPLQVGFLFGVFLPISVAFNWDSGFALGIS